MDYSRYHYLSAERKDKILTVSFNRPESLNAINADLHTELSHIFADIAQDQETEVVVLTGKGRAFCAGGDIKWFQEMTPSQLDALFVEARKIIIDMLEVEQPIIAAVNGPATGLGATLALFSDVIFAADNAKIGDPHVRVGVVAGDGGAVIWPWLVGAARAKEFLLTGDILTAAEAERIGLINRVVPADQLDEKVYGLARRLAGGAMRSIRWTKQAVNIPLRQLAHSMMDLSLSLETQSNLTKDHQEAVWAFAQKRRPNFTGR